MADVTINLHNKDVKVAVPDGGDLTENFNEASAFVRSLAINMKIRDVEAGITPPRATHEVVKENGEWRLKRFRFS